MGRVQPSIISAIDGLKAKSITRAMLGLYSLAGAAALALSAPWWLWQMRRASKYREGLAERLGRIPQRMRGVPAGGVWVHAVSVGEVLAAGRLINELDRALPGATVFISTTTRTGQALARERFGAHRVFYYPLDFAFATRAWLRRLRPSLLILVESEFWPRMLVEARERAIPVAVVNARISDRSWPHYRRLAWLWKPLLGSLSLVPAQSEGDARRLRALGARGAQDVGNLKYDTRAAALNPLTRALRSRLPERVPVIVCGSTLAGEEALLLDALPLPDVVTILAPRHPERFEHVAQLLGERGLRFVRRSGWELSGPSTEAMGASDSETLHPGSILLLDSIGELASLYSLATLAVLGGGFLHPGGHNPLEPAQFGVPVVMGARFENFREIVETLQARQAVVLTDPATLKTTLCKLLADPERMRAIGERGRQVFDERAGATDRTLQGLLALLPAGDEKVQQKEAGA